MNKNFIGYEYCAVTVPQEMLPLYVDGYENFGWNLDAPSAALPVKNRQVTLKFKRDRKQFHKVELTRLQHQFDAGISEILNLEHSKKTKASLVSLTIGVLGTAFLAGATFAYLGGLLPVCIAFAIPGFLGWILPYFLYQTLVNAKAEQIRGLVEGKYDELDQVCEKANHLITETDHEKG